LKANFKISKTNIETGDKIIPDNAESKKELTQEEFEAYIIKSGAAGSFMVYRSNKKEDELGLEEL